ncbi:polyprenyl synthetase family protein [Leucobacter sp. USHLN153]|uniref:polyprenyl synthetase family protein n=1 Tax=Leucobacter sp. USHLN153 TaxID=3081268 RepID=UPI00301730F6
MTRSSAQACDSPSGCDEPEVMGAATLVADRAAEMQSEAAEAAADFEAGSAAVVSESAAEATTEIEAGIAAVVDRLRQSALDRLAPLPLGIDPAAFVDTLVAGKLLRARTVLLVARAYGDPDPDFATDTAAALELLHVASLLHDDIIDESELRRGQPALHVAAGSATAILVADLLIALAYELAAPFGPRASTPLAVAFRRVCEGQLVESGLDWSDDLEAIERYDTLKTGALFGAAFQLGAAASGVDAAVAGAFDESGQRLGLAFQLLDDLIDIEKDTHDLSKDHGADLRNGIPTWPLWSAHRVLQRSAGASNASGAEPRKAIAPEQLAEVANSPEVLGQATARILDLRDESRAILPPAARPELLALASRTVLTGLERFIATGEVTDEAAESEEAADTGDAAETEES